MRIFFIFITAYTIRVIRFKRPFKLVIYCNKKELRSISWCIPSSLVVFIGNNSWIYYAFSFYCLWNILGIFHLAWSISNFTTTLHDCKKSRRRKYHSSLCAVFRFLQNILPSSLVFNSFKIRIYNWQTLNYTSFIAGVVQTFFYADFIYYFMKSNQNQRIINLPIWLR